MVSQVAVSSANSTHRLDSITSLPWKQLVSNSMSRVRLYAVLLASLREYRSRSPAIGIYGVMAYTVVQRTREIGIRMALGAQRAQVLRLVLAKLWLTAGGVILGCTGAAAFTRYLKGMLFGLQPLDPLTIISVALLFVFIAALASYTPAYRATKMDPLSALRYE